MKSISVAGILVCGAIALLGALVPVSASATKLCIEQKEECGSALFIGSPIAGALQGKENFVMETDLGFVTCTKSELAMTVLTVGGAGVSPSTKVSKFTAENCTVPVVGGTQACTVLAVNTGPNAGEQWTGTFTSENPWNKGNGSFGMIKGSLGQPGFAIVCGKKIDCTFYGNPGMAFGAGAPAFLLAVWPMNTMGATCPKAIPTWRGTWSLSKPNPLYLSLE
jgi:hypothetical protein